MPRSWLSLPALLAVQNRDEKLFMNKTLALISPLLLLALLAVMPPIFGVVTRYACTIG